MSIKLASAASAIALILLSLAPSQEALAQGAGTLRGQVVDPSSAVIPNATVVVTGGNGVTRNAKSNGQGQFTISNLPAGTYSVRADAKGFVTFTKPDVNVSPGQATPLDIALQIATEAQEVQVSESSQAQLSVDASSNVSAIVLKEEDLEELPDDPDDLQADLEALAGPAAGPNGAQFFVDGFSGGQLPPKSTIREIRINSNPFSSEFDRPGFGRIEILTKPGSDKYHGMAFFNFGDRVFDSRNPLLTTSPPAYSSKLYTANFGGPLSKRASFLLDFNGRNINENALVNARILDNNFNEVPYNVAVVTPTRYWQLNPRLDYQLSTNNTLVVRYNHTSTSNLGGVGTFSLPTQETQAFNKNNLVQITETAVLGTKAVDETRFQFRDSHNNQIGLGDFLIPGINVNSSFNSGGAPESTNFTHDKSYELQNFVTLAEGRHAIKVGFRAREDDTSSQATSNFNGSYTFAAPNVARGIPACLAGYANPTSLDLYQQTQILLSQGVPISTILAEGCGPTQLTLSGGIPLQSVTQFDLGVYVQDDWRLRPNLTINMGLRYETQTNIQDHMDWAPRVGFAWAPGAKANGASKTVIRGGYGIFYDRFTDTNVLNVLRYNGIEQQNYIITQGLPNAAAALAYYALTPGAAPALPPTSLLNLQNQAIYQIAANFKAPSMSQLAIGVDRQLPARTQMSVNFVDTRGVHLLRTRDINAPCPPGDASICGIAGVRPNPSEGDIYLYESSGIFKQMQIITNVNSRVNSHIQLQGYYTYGQAHTNTSGSQNASGFSMDQYNNAIDWGRASFDARHRGFIGGTVGLPLQIQANPFVTMSSGLPFNITTGSDFNGDSIFNARPAFANGAPCGGNIKCTPYGNFNIAPVAGAALIPYNYGNGPAQFSVNIRLSRTWGWGERAEPTRPNRGGGGGGGGFGAPGGGRGGPRGGFGGGGRGGFGRFGGGNTGKRYNLTLTASARNAFNHANLGQPTGSLISPFFGQSLTLASGGGPGGGGGGGGPGGPFGGGASEAGNRKIEFQLRFQF